MKKIVSKATVILSVILFVISICGASSVDCLKGFIPLQDAIIDSGNVLYGIQCGDMNTLPYKQIPLFYVALVLILLSSVINFTKSTKVKSCIVIALALISISFLLLTHNYIWFLILINLYMLLFALFDFAIKNKINICANIMEIIITILNITQLILHLKLKFNPSNLQYFEKNLIELSGITLKFLLLWIIPFTILLVNDIIITFRQHKDCH